MKDPRKEVHEKLRKIAADLFENPELFNEFAANFERDEKIPAWLEPLCVNLDVNYCIPKQSQDMTKHLVNSVSHDDEYIVESAPIGFPAMIGADLKTTLQWLDSSGVWPKTEQAKSFLQIFSGVTKFSKNDMKRIQKEWTCETSKDPTDKASMLTKCILHPISRNIVPIKLRTDAGWRVHPIGAFIRGAHRLLGLKEPVTYTVFKEMYQNWKPPKSWPKTYWPTFLWECGVSYPDEDSVKARECEQTVEELDLLGRMILSMLYRFLIEAQKWESLTVQQKNGILLGAYSAASYLQSKQLLAPFCAVIPEFKAYVDCDGEFHEGLCSKEGKPTELVDLATALSHIFEHNQADTQFDMTLRLISPLSAALDRVLENPETVRRDLNAYRTAYLINIAQTELLTCKKVQSITDILPKERKNADAVYREHLDEWFEYMGISYIDEIGRFECHQLDDSDVTIGVCDYWQKQFIMRTRKALSLDQWAQDLEQDRNQLSAVQGLMTKALEALETEKLGELALQLNEAKVNLLCTVDEFIHRLEIKDNEREAAEQLRIDTVKAAETAEATDSGEVNVLREQNESLNELVAYHTQQEREYEEEITKLRESLLKETARAEAAEALKDTVSGSVIPCSVVKAMSDKATLVDGLDAIQAMFPNTVEVLASAYEAAASCSYKNVSKMMDSLITLCGDYYDAIVELRQPDAEARACFGSKYRAGESDSTLGVQKLRSLREFHYKDQGKVLFAQHLTIGVKRGEQSCLQIHFKIIDEKVVIARVGGHLPVSSS